MLCKFVHVVFEYSIIPVRPVFIFIANCECLINFIPCSDRRQGSWKEWPSIFGRYSFSKINWFLYFSHWHDFPITTQGKEKKRSHEIFIFSLLIWWVFILTGTKRDIEDNIIPRSVDADDSDVEVNSDDERLIIWHKLHVNNINCVYDVSLMCIYIIELNWTMCVIKVLVYMHVSFRICRTIKGCYLI